MNVREASKRLCLLRRAAHSRWPWPFTGVAASVPRTPKFGHDLQAGFTLLELMITIAVLGILLGVGVPSFMGVIHTNRLATSTNELVTALHAVRTEAIKRGHRVTLCKSPDGNACTTNGNWSQGWIIFDDPNHNASVDTGETILRVGQAAPAGITITGNDSVTNYASYASDSTAKLTTGAFQAGAIRIRMDSNWVTKNVRCLTINASGRLVITTPTTHDGLCS